MANRNYKDKSVSARISEEDKYKLKKSGYNVRQAIEYFNDVSINKFDALKIEQFFLNKEIEQAKYDLIAMEMRAEDLQKEIDKYHIERVSYIRVESYQRIISKYNSYSSKQSFEEFINGTYINDHFISPECDKFPDCDMETFCRDLVEYYHSVALIE